MKNWEQVLGKRHINFRNKRYDVLEERWIGRKKFSLLRRLSNGQRRRFLAFDRHAGSRGALRIVQFMPNTRESWQRTEVLQRLSQRNHELPQLLEFHRQKGEIVSVESWIEGKDLRWWIRKMRNSERSRLGAPESIRLFRQLAHALNHLHRRCGVIHADIKPANIIVNNRTRRFSLIDFGSSWGMERSSTRKAGDGRSEIYSAPEIILNRAGVNFRADYFSLAAVCYETLTLEPPFDGLGSSAALPKYEKQRDSLYVPPSQLSREKDILSREIWQAIDRLLQSSLSLEPSSRPLNGIDWLGQWDSVAGLIRPQAEKPKSLSIKSKLFSWLFDKR